MVRLQRRFTDLPARQVRETTLDISSVISMPIVPKRRIGTVVLGVIVVAAFVSLAVSLFRNPYIDHHTIAQYQFSRVILQGLKTTIVLAVVAQALGIALGVVFALMALSDISVLRRLSAFYVWFFRGVPLLVQILIWGNLALLFKHLVLGVPYTSLKLFSADTNSVITAFVASIVALSMHEGAYMTEIIRGGILSVDRGQLEAAWSIGMTHTAGLRRIILPQAIRVIIPPTGNDFISNIKATSLVAVIAGGDLLTVAQNIAAQNLRTIELLVVATAWYLLLTSLASVGQKFLERRFSRGFAPTSASPPQQNGAGNPPGREAQRGEPT